MSAIKDVADLTTQLIKSVKERHFADELLKIQKMIGEINKEQFDLQIKNNDLTAENASLKKIIEQHRVPFPKQDQRPRAFP